MRRPDRRAGLLTASFTRLPTPRGNAAPDRRPALWRTHNETGPDRMRILRHHHTGPLCLRLGQRQPRRRHSTLPRSLEAPLHLGAPGTRPTLGANRRGTGAGASPQPQAQGDVQQVQPLLPHQPRLVQGPRLHGRRPTHRGVDLRTALLGIRHQGPVARRRRAPHRPGLCREGDAHSRPRHGAWPSEGLTGRDTPAHGPESTSTPGRTRERTSRWSPRGSKRSSRGPPSPTS